MAKSAGRSSSATRCVTSRSHGYAPLARTRGQRGLSEACGGTSRARQLLVVQPVGVDRRPGLARQAAEHDDGAARPHELDRVRPRLLIPGRLDHDVRLTAVPHFRAELLDERAALLAAPDDHGPAACVRNARRQHQPDRPGAEDRDGVAGGDSRPLDPAQAARERLDHRRHLRRDSTRHVVQVDRRDPLGHDEPLGIRAGEERERTALLAALAPWASSARRGVRRDDTAPVDEAAELMPEASRRLREQKWMAPPVRLQVGAVRERDLDLDEHLSRPRLGPWNLLDPQIARRVEQRRLHGVNTTLSASPRR